MRKTGSPERAWSSFHSVVVPALLVAVESTWASLVLVALLRSGQGGHEDVPFLALALPGALGAAATGWTARLGAGRPAAGPSAPGGSAGGAGARRALVLAPLLLVSWLAGSALYDGVVLAGGYASVAHPWTLSPEPAQRAVVALSLCGLAAARGSWIAWREPRTGAVLVSLSIGAAIFGLVLAISAFHHGEPFFEHLGRDAAGLLFVALPGGVAGLAFVRERDLERLAPLRAAARPNAGWLLSIALPVGAAGLGALALLELASPLAPPVGHLVQDAARGVGALLAALFRLLAHVAPRVSLSGQPGAPPLLKPPTTPPALRRAPGRALPAWIADALLGVGALAALGLGALVLGALRRRWRRPGWRRLAGEGEELRDSVFSFAHLLDQLLDSLRRRLAARTREPVPAEGAGSGPQGAGAPAPEPEPQSVRRHYRLLLERARAAGLGRAGPETPLELERRLEAEPASLEASALAPLTALYVAARYGEVPDTADSLRRARELVDRLLASIRPAPAPHAGDDAEPTGSSGA